MRTNVGPRVGARREARDGRLHRAAAVLAIVAVALLVPLPRPASADGAGQGQQTGQGDQGGADGSHLRAVLQCVTANVGPGGSAASYTAVWGFTGLSAGTYRIPDDWDNSLDDGSARPPTSVSGDGDSTSVSGTWTSTFKTASATWRFHGQAVTAGPSSAPCSPAPQVPEVPSALVAPLLTAGGLGAGILLYRRRVRRGGRLAH